MNALMPLKNGNLLARLWRAGTALVAGLLITGAASAQLLNPAPAQPAGAQKAQLPSFESAMPVDPAVASLNLEPHSPCAYPSSAKEMGIAGSVKIKLLITEAGLVRGTGVVSGPGPLRNAALRCVEMYRYKPFARDGNAVAASTEVQISFPQDALNGASQKLYDLNRNEAQALVNAGNLERAAQLYKKNLELLEKESPDSHIQIAEEATQLGHIRMKQQQFEEAEGYLKKAIAMYDSEHVGSPLVGRTAEELGGLYLKRKDFAGAQAMFNRAITIFFRQKVVAASPEMEKSMSTSIAKALLGDAAADFQSGDAKKASTFCERAVNESRSSDISPAELKEMYTSCSAVSRAAGNPEQADAWKNMAERVALAVSQK
ncbi:MAG: energy transducer TonB [Acidobacteria bacterium]|nr:energy transducer TonB [Acidobacteriota bacterium]